MKKTILYPLGIFLVSALCLIACGKDEKKPEKEPESITTAPSPEVTVSTVTLQPTPTPTPTPSPQPTKTPEPTPIPQPTAVPWDQLYDYSQDQPVFLPDGEIKNLSIQLGSAPGELHLTWFSKSSEPGHAVFYSEYGDEHSATATTQESISVPNYYRNRAVISGLATNTSYEYQIGNGRWVSPVLNYRTKDFTSDSFTFTIASDQEIGLGDLDDNVYEIHSTDWRRALNRMKHQIPDSAFLLSMGDHVARKDAPAEYDLFLDQSILYGEPLMPVVGNHDASSGFFGDHFFLPNASSHGVESGDDGDYWFIYGDVLFMVLNNLSTCDDIDHQLFIQETIEQHPDTKWRVLVSHYSPVSNVERYQGTAESVDDYFDYAELFDIDLFLGGHDHVYTRSYLMTDDDEFLSSPEEHEFVNPQGALYVIFSSATSSLYREPDDYPWAAKSVQTYHPQISEATVTENSFTITTYEADTWTELDTFTIYKD